MGVILDLLEYIEKVKEPIGKADTEYLGLFVFQTKLLPTP
jgi:hypothetical protein